LPISRRRCSFQPDHAAWNTAGRPSTTRRDVATASVDGRAWSKPHQARPLIAANKRAGIEPSVNFHALRLTYASHLAVAGVSMLVIAKNLGHADTRTTEKHYAHLSSSQVAMAIRAANMDLIVATAS